ncbi:AAA family ATPase [Klebsiella quasipneumoniae subsp. similipneumoniae]
MDENNSQDMGRLIVGCDAIKNETSASVLLVHHSGKDETKGARVQVH